MPGRPGDPVWAVFLTCVLSHLPMIPTLVLLHRRRLPYECVNGMYSVLVSFMYHACEAADTTFVLSAGQWHRLDNIGAIGSIIVTCVHIACLEDQEMADYIKYGAAMVIAILQEGYPWDVRFTAAPILVGGVLPLASHIMHPRRRRGVIWRRLTISGLLFLIAIVFFAVGLDDRNDPFRMFHGLFHCFVAAAMFCTWTAIRPVRREGVKASPPTSKSADREGDEYSIAFIA